MSKAAAEKGETQFEFKSWEIDQYSKRLLEADGFSVFSTTKINESSKMNYLDRTERQESIWIARW
jgi:hypothetical protein